MLRETRSWLSSPLGKNTLLSLLKPERNREKYLKIREQLKDVKGFDLKSKIFLSHNNKFKIKSENNCEIVDFSRPNGHAVIFEWLRKNGCRSCDIDKYISAKTEYIFMNVANLQMSWNKTEGCSPLMTVYNTFSYTEDIKYDASLLDLPLCNNEFKLMILVPNYMHIAYCLFKKLSEEGLKSAVQSIHPLFTTVSELKSPIIEFQSANEIKIEEGACDVSSVEISVASVKINEKGVDINSLTCIHSGKSSPSKYNHNLDVTSALKPFLFAIVFKDTAIFTGQYVCND